ncbi:MAG: zinc-binding dehydrogenase [Brevibacterium aurantiacum]|uniref:Zinc-binding dehydrogenase n=1 Tax=Brevibacterium aurantiacum TaxID=273384 RepID=A0A2A3Z9H0_BREAU|nr:zinc-binding dehydrogenase [Brevibacterium aurantiacum]PCC48184.1 hypothetical protein CIK64_00300 [Brevibacterium aurantiacum]SMX91048.1 Zinc-binding dehydrogenase [Brevibacterium aurantiacum]
MTSHLEPETGALMRAVVRTDSASEHVAFAEVPVPAFAADELLVRVQAIGVGIHDPLFLPVEAQYPYTIGIGAAVTVSGDPLVAERSITVCGLDYATRVQTDLQALIDDVAEGALQVEIERRYAFHEALEAIEKVRSRHARGKVVITLE